MAKFKVTKSKPTIEVTTYEVEANDEMEALELVKSGNVVASNSEIQNPEEAYHISLNSGMGFNV
jgi:hypothetical protein